MDLSKLNASNASRLRKLCDPHLSRAFILFIFNLTSGPCRLVVRSSRCGYRNSVKTEARILPGTFFCILLLAAHRMQMTPVQIRHLSP